MEKLRKIQTHVKVGKSRWNKFNGFWYRSCEDICKALVEVEKNENCLFVMSDTMSEVGGLPTVIAKIAFIDLDNGTRVEGSAQVIIDHNRKGMSAEQASGAASSYARKIALAGLLMLDDEADPDVPTGDDEQYVSAINACMDANQLQSYMNQVYQYDQKLYQRIQSTAQKRMKLLTNSQKDGNI